MSSDVTQDATLRHDLAQSNAIGGSTSCTSQSNQTTHHSSNTFTSEHTTEEASQDRNSTSEEITRGRDPAREDIEAEAATEQTPLLVRESSHEGPDQSQPQREHSASGLLRELRRKSSGDGKGSHRRWPSLLALLLLCIFAILIMVFAFISPSIVEEYAQKAVEFEPTSLSIDSFTSEGVKARVQGNFMLDASKVEEKNVRNIGRLATWFAREIKTGRSELEVSLPEYGNVVLGTADIPPIKVGIRNGHRTHVDFLSDLQPGDVDGIRRIANDWIDGRLGQLRILGKAKVPLNSGIFNLGKQLIEQEVTFANKDIPTIPEYKIEKLNFREIEIPSGTGMAADVALLVKNDYPVDFTIPPLGFGILVDNCQKNDPYIMIADALTHDLHIRPQRDVELNVTGNVRQLPHDFIQACPGSHESPLDAILGKYIHGNDTTIYVKGSDSPSADTPQWIMDLMKDITVPVSLPGRTFGSLIKNFTLDETHFGLPDPFADPDSKESNPSISSNIKAVVALPEEMNFNISVGRVRADADVFYEGKKLGRLDLRKWQNANSTRIQPDGKDDGPSLLVQSKINDAPLDITDNQVFTDVVQALLFGSKSVFMHIKAEVDVETETALGTFAIRKIPAEGQVPIKPISRGGNGTGDAVDQRLRPQVFDLNIINTTESSLTISALVNLTNPTNYSATVPYADINILTNDTLLGHATVRDLYIGPGNNTNIPVIAVWDPLALGGKPSAAVGREFLSQYISGWNTTLTLQTHNATIPALPNLGLALSHFPLTLSTPRLGGGAKPPPSHGGDEDNDDPKKDGPHFIEDATFHLLTSSATFTLLSPLRRTTLSVTSINATAIYKHHPAGKILYDVPFEVPPVDADGNGVVTPRLPVDWSLGSVGYDAVKKALGGSLKLGAEAVVGVRIGRWEEEVWFVGGGIGARVRI